LCDPFIRSRLIFPEAVVLNRLHAPRCDFILGMIVLDCFI
jgi:hypothetical protein